METKNWNYFNRKYTAADITSDTLVLVFETYGLACGPCSYSFLHLLKDKEELPLFLAALASVSDSTDEMFLTMTLESFLAEHNMSLLEDFNLKSEQQLPAGYKFEILGDEERIAEAIYSHNALQA